MDEDKATAPAHVSQQTPISVGLMLVLLGSISGGVFYVATSLAMASTLSARVDRVELRQESYASDITEIKERLARIEEMIRIGRVKK
jgi:hypothetical protein